RPLPSGRCRATGLGDHPVAVLVDLDIPERDQVRRPLAGLRELELADLGLDLPRIVVAALEPQVAEAHRARARQPAVLDRMARPDDDVREPIGAGSEGVPLALGER